MLDLYSLLISIYIFDDNVDASVYGWELRGLKAATHTLSGKSLRRRVGALMLTLPLPLLGAELPQVRLRPQRPSDALICTLRSHVGLFRAIIRAPALMV